MSVLSTPQSQHPTRDQQRLTDALQEISPPSCPPNWSQRLCQRALFSRLMNLRQGQLEIRHAEGHHTFGQAKHDEKASLQILQPRAYEQIAWGGSLGAADAFVEGHWQSDDLLAVMRLFARNVTNHRLFPQLLLPLSQLGRRLWQVLHINSRPGSKRNIGFHYDLSNEFFSLFLDPTMTYSSGLFVSAETTLEAASLAKYELICRKLDLQPGDHVLEIGCGWGGFAEYAVKNFGCRVTGITISQQQLNYAEQRIAAAGLSEQVDLRFCDYRDMTGSFDKLVSIEMIEAVGHEYLPTFFSQCNTLLKAGGTMVLQSILIPEQRYDKYRRSTDFIQKYIFPGGCLPSVGSISRAVRKTPDLRLLHFEDFAADYAQTLLAWREAFQKSAGKIAELGFDAKFRRVWDYYFCYCAGGFLENKIGVGQMTLTRD